MARGRGGGGIEYADGGEMVARMGLLVARMGLPNPFLSLLTVFLVKKFYTLQLNEVMRNELHFFELKIFNYRMPS